MFIRIPSNFARHADVKFLNAWPYFIFKSSSTLAENKLGIVSEYTGPPSNTGMTDLKSQELPRHKH